MIDELLPQKELESQFWDKKKHLNPDVRYHMLKIALEFKKYLQLPETKLVHKIKLVDVKFTGSLCNYNHSKYSDIDLHLVFDMKEVPQEEKPLATEYLLARKAMWNGEHEINIFGYDVELYPEEEGQPHYSTGTYSVLHDKWIREPQYEDIHPDKELIKKKVTGVLIVLNAIGKAKISPEEIVKGIEYLQSKIKKMRQAGLEKEGEYSPENLAFKVLRRMGVLDTISELKRTVLDKSISLEK